MKIFGQSLDVAVSSSAHSNNLLKLV